MNKVNIHNYGATPPLLISTTRAVASKTGGALAAPAKHRGVSSLISVSPPPASM
jgi:hypothetical protein